MPEVIEIYETRIAAWTEDAGMVWRWVNKKMHEVKDLAEAQCPYGGPYWGRGRVGGVLKASHFVDMVGNQYIARGTVGNDVPYALFVHDGTATPIEPNDPAGWLRFSINGRGFKKKSVRGQDPNPWLSDAFYEIMR